MIEFPKVVYLAGDPASEDSFVVKNRDEEASARVRGYVPAPQTILTPAQSASGPFLEYPKALSRGEETLIAKDAEAEAALRAQGFLGAGEDIASAESADDTSTPVSADTPAKATRTRKPKQ